MIRASIYKPKRKRGGKVVTGKLWRLRYKLDGERRYHDVALGVRDETVANQKLAAFVQEKEWEARGVIPPKRLREGAATTMADHLADFLSELRGIRRDDMYVYNLDKRIQKLLGECSWQLPGDVTPDSFMAWRRRQTKSAKTLNDYLDAANALLNWMKQQGRLLQNPLIGAVRKVSTCESESPWRALSDDEVTRLLAAAGPRRAVYLTAVLTGLRRAELEALRWTDVHLDAVKPYFSVRGSTTKNRKPAIIWLRDDLVSSLRSIRPAACVGMVFEGGVPTMEQVRIDLAAAGIRPIDEDGRKVVFHSLRHTLATNLARSNVPARVAMEVMRHSDMRLTMKVYTDAKQLPTADVLDKLPRFGGGVVESLPMRATGTDSAGVSENDTQKDTQSRVKSGRDESQLVHVASRGEMTEVVNQAGLSPNLSGSVTSSPDVAASWGTRIRT